jgi:hypothetical protein
VVTAVAAVFVMLIVLQQLALRDVRRVEALYIAGREPTACATQGLAEGAFSIDQSELPANVLALVRQGAAGSREVRDRAATRDVVRIPLPAIADAQDAVREALDDQVVLYDAMIDEPAASEPKLRTLGLANTRAERRIRTARRWVLAGETEAWKRRFICDTGNALSTKRGDGQSSPSSSK